MNKFFASYASPSLFLMIRDAIEAFIRNATGKENVLVALPDLDKLLLFKLHQLLEDLDKQKPDTTTYGPDQKRLVDYFDQGGGFGGAGASGTWDFMPPTENIDKKIEALGNLLELIGLKLTSALEGSEMKKNSETMEDYFAIQSIKDNHWRATVECDHTTQTVVEKLESIGNKISEIVNEENGEPLKFTKPYVEVDYDIISTLKDFNLIYNNLDPLIIWGEENFILNFVQARIMEIERGELGTLPDFGIFKKYVEKGTAPNLMFRVEGLDREYLTKLTRILNPYNPSRTSLGEEVPLKKFGGGPAATILPLDFRNKLRESSEASNDFRHNPPVFLFGVPDSNILSFDLDLKNQYTTILTTIVPSGNKAELTVGALIPAGFGEQFNKVFKTWNFKRITDEFKEICDTFIEEPVRGGNELINFDEWKNIIKESGGKDLTGQKVDLFTVPKSVELASMADRNPRTLAGPSKDLKDRYYTFMWAIFSKLFIKHRKELNKNIKLISGKEPEIGAISYLNQVAQKLSEMSLTAKVKSIPMFHLSSDYAAVNRSCVVYCREAKFAGVDKAVPEYTWFSGIYTMMGYIHTITKSSVESEFLLVRGPQSIAPEDDTIPIEDYNKMTDEDKADAQATGRVQKGASGGW
mgnify:FL=1